MSNQRAITASKPIKKAKSRLKKSAPTSLTEPIIKSKSISDLHPQPIRDFSVISGLAVTSHNFPIVSTLTTSFQQAYSNYLATAHNYLQVLIIGLFFYLLTFLLMTNISPAQVANFPLTDTYFIFQLLLAGGNFFFFTFLTQKKFLGGLFTLAIAIFLFCRFQGML